MPRVVSLDDLSRDPKELVRSVASTGDAVVVQEASQTLAVVAPGTGTGLPQWGEWTERGAPLAFTTAPAASAEIEKAILGFDPEAGAVGTPGGRQTLASELDRLGVPVNDPGLLDAIYARVIGLCDDKERIYEEDLRVLAHEAIAEAPQRLRLLAMTVTCSTRMPAMAEVTLELSHGPAMRRAQGDGPLHAAFTAIDQLVGIKPEVENFTVVAATRGQDAIAEATIAMSFEGRAVVGRGASTDAVEAGVHAYLNALNFLLEANRGLAPAPKAEP